jgi:hypothetical protein
VVRSTGKAGKEDGDGAPVPDEGLLALDEAPDEGLLVPIQGPKLPGLTEGLGVAKGELFSPERHLAQSRRGLAYWLMAILSVLLLLPWFALLTHSAEVDAIQALMTIVFAPVVGLVGAATGFYFGERVGQASSNQSPS